MQFGPCTVESEKTDIYKAVAEIRYKLAIEHDFIWEATQKPSCDSPKTPVWKEVVCDNFGYEERAERPSWEERFDALRYYDRQITYLLTNGEERGGIMKSVTTSLENSDFPDYYTRYCELYFDLLRDGFKMAGAAGFEQDTDDDDHDWISPSMSPLNIGFDSKEETTERVAHLFDGDRPMVNLRGEYKYITDPRFEDVFGVTVLHFAPALVDLKEFETDYETHTLEEPPADAPRPPTDYGRRNRRFYDSYEEIKLKEEYKFHIYGVYRSEPFTDHFADVTVDDKTSKCHSQMTMKCMANPYYAKSGRSCDADSSPPVRISVLPISNCGGMAKLTHPKYDDTKDIGRFEAKPDHIWANSSAKKVVARSAGYTQKIQIGVQGKDDSYHVIATGSEIRCLWTGEMGSPEKEYGTRALWVQSSDSPSIYCLKVFNRGIYMCEFKSALVVRGDSIIRAILGGLRRMRVDEKCRHMDILSAWCDIPKNVRWVCLDRLTCGKMKAYNLCHLKLMLSDVMCFRRKECSIYCDDKLWDDKWESVRDGSHFCIQRKR